MRSLVQFNRRRAETLCPSAPERVIRSVGIVGAGTMGASIAAVTVRHRLRVVITDACDRELEDLPARVARELPEQAPSAGGPAKWSGSPWLQPTADLGSIARCDLVVETVVEDPSAKQQIFGQLETELGEDTILTSNTSTIPINRLAAGLADPARFCGVHFFHPVRDRRLVEIVRGSQSSDSTLAAAVGYVRAIGKIPLIVNDGPGFLVNRLLLPYASEAMQLLLEGAEVEAVERAGVEFGMTWGPLRLLDEVGLDTALDCGWVLAGSYPNTVAVAASPLLAAMVKAGRLGRKSGAGFFTYGDPRGKTRAVRPNPAVNEMITRWAEPRGRHTPQTIITRLFLPMLLEATRILQEGIVSDPRLVDFGLIFGLGFPRARGGLLYWADTLGARRIVDMLRPLAPLGPRAEPTPMLREMAEQDRRFYEDRV